MFFYELAFLFYATQQAHSLYFLKDTHGSGSPELLQKVAKKNGTNLLEVKQSILREMSSKESFTVIDFKI